MMLSTRLAAWRRWADHALDERDRRRDRQEAVLLCVAAVFVLGNAVALGVARGAWDWAILGPPAVWLIVAVAAHMTIRALKPARDPYLLPIFVLLTGWGLLLQERLASNFLPRQTLWFVLATVTLVIVAVLPRTLQPLMRYRYVLLVGGLALLAITLIFGVNPSGSGAALWLPIPMPFIGPVFFQPSELLKVLLVIFLASYFTEREPLYRQARQATRLSNGQQPAIGRRVAHVMPFLGPLVLMWGFCLLLLVWQQDLGAAALFFIVFLALLYLATGEKLYVISGLVMLLLAGVFAFFAFDAVVAPRVLTWLNPWPNVSDRAYQVVQSLYAQAAGGIAGQGIGQGFPDYIPVVHSDFALAAIAEEWGLLGSLTVVAAFVVLAMRGLRAALLVLYGRRPNFFHAYLAAGLVVLFAVQTMLIIGGVTKLLPLTGITLPFISYGGSSLVVSGAMVGLLTFLSADGDTTPAAQAHDRRLARRIERLALAILAGFAALALTLAYWSVVRGDVLATRPDNPRLVEAERRVRRGRILDRDGRVLAESVPANGAVRRVYPLAQSDPAVGYYSVRFGAAGIEAALDPALRGQADGLWAEVGRRLLDEPPAGRHVQLTLDAELQTVAGGAMAGHTGGLVLLEVTPGDDSPAADIRALVSVPGYDANLLDEQYEALAADDPGPLFDRATQGLYQPGLVTQPLITAAALDNAGLSLDDPLDQPFMPVNLDGQVQRCAEPRATATGGTLTWADMGRLRCPAPMAALGEQLGAAALQEAFERFGLSEAPALPIPTAAAADPVIGDLGLAAIGQDTLTITPLQAALAIAALAGDGRLPAPRLVEAVSDGAGGWQTWPAAAATIESTSADTAEAIRATWPVEDNIAAFSVSTLAGPEGRRDTWFLGFTPADSPRYVIALVLEDEAQVSVSETIGRATLQAANP